MKSKKECVWIIEMKDNDKWIPTIGIELTEHDIKLELEKWKKKYHWKSLRYNKYLQKTS